MAPRATERRLQQQAKATLEARSETALKRAIVQRLNLVSDVFVFPINVGAVTAEHKGKRRFVRFGFPGLVDVIGWKVTECSWKVAGSRWDVLRAPIFLGLEVKRPAHVPDVLAGFVVSAQRRYLKTTGTAKQRAEQQRAFLQMVRQAGGIAVVVTSVAEAVEAVRNPSRSV